MLSHLKLVACEPKDCFPSAKEFSDVHIQRQTLRRYKDQKCKSPLTLYESQYNALCTV